MKILQIEKCVCLLHESRYDNKKYIEKLGQKVGLDINFFVVGNKNSKHKLDRIDQSDNKYININFSHREIINKAKDDGYKNLLLLEDDITFTKDFTQILSQINLEENCAGINLGGYCQYPDIQNKYYHMDELLITPYRMWGLFGTLINRFAFDWFIRYNPESRSSPLDNILSDYSNDRELILTKPIIIERPMRSEASDYYKSSPIYEQAMKEGRLWKDEEIMSPLFNKIKYTNYTKEYPSFLWRK